LTRSRSDRLKFVATSHFYIKHQKNFKSFGIDQEKKAFCIQAC
jgi:hypothetical protein